MPVTCHDAGADGALRAASLTGERSPSPVGLAQNARQDRFVMQ